MERVLQDVRYGARLFRKKPGLTIVAVLTLAIGIGANTAIFSIVNTVVLRPLPYRDSDRLVWFHETNLPKGRSELLAAPPTFLDWRSRQQSFEQIAAYSEGGATTLTGQGEPETVTAVYISADLMPMLGIQPALGRSFLAEDDQAGSRPVAILSEGLWRRRFGSDTDILNKTIVLDDRPHEVIGIAPAGFSYPDGAELWMPLIPKIADALTVRGAHFLSVIGRLKPGVALAQAEAEISAISDRIAENDPQYEGFGVRLVTLHEKITGKVRPALLIILAAVGFVLLIACANVANLLLAQATTRQREVAVRMALGAGRPRLVRQLLTESLMLAMMGGAMGLLLALWGIDIFIALSPPGLPRAAEIAMSGDVLAYTLAISLATGIIFGLAPALQSSKQDLAASLKEASASATAGVARNRLRSLLVVSEVALSFVLVVSAGLMINSLARLLRVDPGFDPDGVAFRLSLSASRYPEKRQQADFFKRLLERVEALPGVRSVGATRNLPISGQSMTSPIVIEGANAPGSNESFSVQYATVSPGYFRTMSIRLIKGRDFTERDGEESTPVAIINETLARRFFPGENPIGKRLRTLFGRPVMREVVGVVGDVRHAALATDAPPQVYAPYLQNPERFLTVVVRADIDRASIAAAVRSAVLAIDKDQPIEMTATMSELISNSVSQSRFYTLLLAGFAGIALALAAAGIYGVMSYSVTQRTHEIGIRMALGGQSKDVMRLVLKQGFVLALAGVSLGLAGAFLLTRLLSGLLYEVSATDPITFAGTAMILVGVALAACFVPARQATNLDPIAALRHE